MMTVGKFIALRKAIGLSQTEWGEQLGLSLRAVQDIEGGRTPLRRIHSLAAKQIALEIAVERREPMLAPTSVRRAAVQLSNDLVGPA